MEVTTRPYWKDRTRQHVDIMFPHPHTQQPFRKRIVAPVGMDAVAATEWGRDQAMHLFKKLCKAPTDVDAQDKEDKPAAKTRPAKAPRLMEIWDTFISEHVLPLKHSSHAGYAESWQNHFKDALGAMRLDEIDAIALNQFRSALEKKGLSVQEDAGIPKLGPHRIRHSVLTFLAENGVQPYELQAFARHADAATTNRYYVHINRRKLARQAVRTLAGLISPEPMPPARTTLLGNDVATAGNKPQIRAVA